MDMIKQQGMWAQCTQCGKIDFFDISVPIDTVYINMKCNKCGNIKMLNCGDKQEDIYKYYDYCLDSRYYY